MVVFLCKESADRFPYSIHRSGLLSGIVELDEESKKSIDFLRNNECEIGEDTEAFSAECVDIPDSSEKESDRFQNLFKDTHT